MVQTRRHPLWLLSGFWICIVIAIAVVLRRLLALIRPSNGAPAQMAQIDATFASHTLLTVLHIVPAAVFVIISAVILLRGARSESLERAFFSFGLITSLTAYAMNAYAIGGWVERAAVLVFNTWFLFSLTRAYLFRHAGDRVRQREWMTRGVGVLLGIATTRPVMGTFFATSPLTHLRPTQFFGIAFWIGFSINAAVVELWLHSTERRRLQKTGTIEQIPISSG